MTFVRGSLAATGAHHAKPVAETTDRLDQLDLRAELRAQTLHVHVDGTRLHIRRRFPDVLEQLRATLHASATRRQRQEQLELRGSELDMTSRDRDTMVCAVDDERPNDHDVAADSRDASTAQDGADAQDELLRAEGFREIIVGAEH